MGVHRTVRFEAARRLAGDIVSLVWPRVCAACGGSCEGQVCEACRAAVSVRTSDGCCAICGKTILVSDGAAGTAAPACAGCRERRPAFEQARSAVDYAGPARQIVQTLKYRKGRGVAPWMAEWMAGCVVANWPDEPFDAVVPVPLHPSREAGRGYNQSALLAAALAKLLSLPCAPRILARTRDTGTQTKLDAKARRANMERAFEVRRGRADAVRGKSVLLVDDVMTTGATLGAAAAALRAAGAGRTFALSFARG